MPGDLVLVTGATGYLATYVIKLLLERDFRVRATVRSMRDDVKMKPLHRLSEAAKYPLQLVEADITDPEPWGNITRDCMYVHHIASPGKRVKNASNQAIQGTLNVLRACGTSVQRVILTSCVSAVTGLEGREKPYTENDWANPELANTYAKSKIRAEKAAWEYMEHEKKIHQNFDLAVINPGFMMGPVLCGTMTDHMGLIKMMMERGEMALLNLAFPVCDVRDAAEAHVNAMTNSQTAGNRHLIVSQTASLPEIAQILKEEFNRQGYNVLCTVAPTKAAKVLGVFMQKLRHLLPSLNQQPECDTSRMLTVLKMAPRDAREAVLDMAYSMIEAGFIRKTSKYTGPQSADTIYSLQSPEVNSDWMYK